MNSERRYSGVEVRAEGRRLIGPAIQYGEISPSHRERFEAGAFAALDERTRWLDVNHDRDKVIAHTDGGGLEINDSQTALDVRATLAEIPAADGALEAVRAGILRGFSIEFVALSERRESDIRVIESAELRGIGLVRNPSYESSIVEVRAGSMRSTIPFRSRLDCECTGRNVCTIEIDDISFDDERDVLATAGRLEHAVASRKTGSLKLNKTRAGLEVTIAAEVIAATEAGQQMIKTAGVVPVYARPLIDADASKFTERDGVVVYSDMRVKGILLKPTFNNSGWTPVEFGEAQREARQPIKTNKRERRWL